MSRERDIDVLPFTETIPPLALAPLAGLAMLACGSLPQTGLANVLIVALYMAPFCYGAAAVFVLPIFAIWPPLRRPSYPVAAIWGILSAWVRDTEPNEERPYRPQFRMGYRSPFVQIGHSAYAATALCLSRRPISSSRLQTCLHGMRCGATTLINSRDVITLVFFQNFGKCRWLPVTR